MTIAEYIQNPCRAASLPYWKTKAVRVPDTMKILHAEDFDESFLQEYHDTPYFRLIHPLRDLADCPLPAGFAFASASAEDFAAHINSCYDALHVSPEELRSYITRPVYCPDLWIVIEDTESKKIVASGIAELDKEVSEGVLEWIQVSGVYRRQGLGRCIVLELLRRMRGKARFATVSGQCSNATNPEALYRSCGFIGNDIWHIMKK